jgi:hypothetical protein
VSHHSRRSEDMDNPWWSSRWAGWGIRSDSEEPDPEINPTNGICYPQNSLHLTAHSSDYSPDSNYPPPTRRTGHQTFVACVADGDDETCDAENESEVSLERITGAPRSLHMVTATEPLQQISLRNQGGWNAPLKCVHNFAHSANGCAHPAPGNAGSGI